MMTQANYAPRNSGRFNSAKVRLIQQSPWKPLGEIILTSMTELQIIFSFYLQH